MKRFIQSISLVLLVVFFGVSSFAQAPAVQGTQQSKAIATKDARLFPLEDLRPGMKGTASTVFSGTEAQEFGVEILGVLPGFPGPRQSAIIAKLTGSNVEKTGVFAGMSGSPVYIDGRLVGAIAFTFPFSKEPIAGITPIKQMIDIFEKGSVDENQKSRDPRTVSFAQLASTEWKPTLPKPAVTGAPLFAPVSGGSPLIALMGQQMIPIATPVVFGGISQDSLSLFAAQLTANGLLPVSGVGGSAAITALGRPTENSRARDIRQCATRSWRLFDRSVGNRHFSGC